MTPEATPETHPATLGQALPAALSGLTRLPSEVPGMGRVALVGAGPGDPELITVRGLKRLRRADVVVHDRLVHPDLLDEAPRAERVYVGKKPGAHACTQDEIHAVLVHHARAGRFVVRLQGGDPFVFGRGGEEVLALAAAGVPCEVVPGLSSALAGPAWAGIPATFRGRAASFAVVTAHRAGGDEDGGALDEPDWDALARIDTLIILMGVGRLPRIVDALLTTGRSPDTPVAVVERATLPDGRAITASLGDVVAVAARAHLRSPAVIVVGDVVTSCGEVRTDLHQPPGPGLPASSFAWT